MASIAVERPTLRAAGVNRSVARGALLLAVLGVLLIVARAGPGAEARAPLLGNLLMIGTVVVWAVYTMLAKRAADADPIVVTAGVSFLGMLMLIPGALAEAAQVPTPPISVATWARIAYLGAFPSAASYLLYNRALRDLDASLVGIFTNLSPLIGVVSGIVFLGETITPLGIAGGVAVLAGVWISTASETRPRAEARS
jgi:drug/metabolite transporter (DMT)-like permease